jgi:hypothetical protein
MVQKSTLVSGSGHWSGGMWYFLITLVQTIFLGQDYTTTMHKQAYINNTNKTRTLLQETGGNEEPNIDIVMLVGQLEYNLSGV